MAIPRPKRSSRRYRGDQAVGTEGITDLSTLKRRRAADGRKMLLRYAAAAVAAITVIFVFWELFGGKKPATSIAGQGVTMDDYLKIPKTPTAPPDAFEKITHQSLDDLKASVAHYRHKKSGMTIVAMTPADPFQDATFGINFRTPSQGEDGVQSVVQRAIMAGSVNYPVKDPFNQLKRGSLQTYSDAWTEKDRTSFVISSRNLADFQNNMKVTIDAVFHPLFIDEKYKWIYRQEGWRLDTEDNIHLQIKGNGYVEAKAAQMDPEEVMVKQIYRNLFADHVYSKNHKGEAAEVVTMTYQEVIAYYKTYYHPSNGQGFCFGKQEFIDACLDELHDVLRTYEEDESVRKYSQIGWQDLTDLEKEIKSIPYPDYQETVDYRSVVAWVLNEQPMDLRTQVAWHLIYELLAGSPTAPVAKVISDLNLGTDIVTHFQHSLQQWVMALGVSGIVSQDDVQRANEKITKELLIIASDGFEHDDIEAALHKIEFQFREQSAGDMPRGAQYFKEILSHWNYDRDPLLPLHASKTFTELKTEILENGQKFLLELIIAQMFDSKHTTSLDLHPSMNFALTYERKERDWLNSLDQYLNEDEGRQYLAETGHMKKIQETSDSEEALMTIPRLELSELNETQYIAEYSTLEDLFESGITTLEHELPFTNGIAYVDLAFDISNMDFDDVVLIPLFCQLLLEGGTENSDDVETQQEIDKYTGGITITPMIEEIVETDSEGFYTVPDGKHFVTKLIISGSCIADDTCLPMFNLFRQFVWESDVRNKEKAIEILEARINKMEQDIQTNGHKYTTTRVESRYSLSGFVREQWYGVTQLMQMRRVLALIKDNFTDMSLRLIKMQDALKRGHRNGMLMSVTGDELALKDLKGPLRSFLEDILPLATQREPFQNFAEKEHPWVPKGYHRVEEEFAQEFKNQAFTVPTRVNHIAKGGVLYDVGERIPGADMVVLQYLGGHYLYDELHFNQGAEDGWALLDLDSGVCIYQSDRDPTIFSTLDTYEAGATWLWDQVHDGELPFEAEGSIIGAVGRLDANIMTEPNNLGYDSLVSYLKQDEAQYRQLWRDQILGSNAKDFMDMVERLGSWGHPSVSIVTSPEIFDSIDQEDFPITRCDYSGYQC